MNKEASKLLRDMAAQIDRNEGSGFGGCFVIVPPEGKAISVLLLDTAQDAAQFWGMIVPKANIALAELAQNQRSQQAGQAFARR